MTDKRPLDRALGAALAAIEGAFADRRALEPGKPGTPAYPQPGAAETLGLEDREERAAILEYDHGLPRAEAERLAGLRPAPDPGAAADQEAAPAGVPPEWWRGAILFREARRLRRGKSERAAEIAEDLVRLLRDHGADLARLGWSVEAVAGVCPERPISRVERQGLAARMRGRTVGSITAAGAFLLEPNEPDERFTVADLREGGVAVWAVVPGTARPR